MVKRLILFFLASSFFFIEILLAKELQYRAEETTFRFDYEIIEDKSSSFEDDKERRILKILLPNGLKALLISDPSLTDSAAAVSVDSGTWDDPDEHPGMAHFVEHLLFLGTESYPKESDYSQYVLERGGQYNAFTRHDRTNYGFSIPNSGFRGALDRLAHFFIDPIFSDSAIERETFAVHHEFEDSIENDSLRVWRVLKESGNQDHPNSKFSCGNLNSLSKVSHSDVHQWFKKHYHPEGMKLVLMSHEPLEVLAELASQFFSKIPPRKKEAIVRKTGYETPLLAPQQKGHFIYINPSFKNRSLYLMWEIPEYFLEHENNKAVHLVQMALDHGYSNSLSHLLEKEELAMEVNIDFWKIEKKHAFFMINIVLTDEGIADYEKVIAITFQTINRLKQLSFPDYLFKKLQYLNSTQLHSSFDSSFEYVMKVSSELIDEEIETYPDLTYIAPQSSQLRASSFLKELNPFDCTYCLIALPEEVGVKLSRVEKWMGSEYLLRKIRDETLQKWKESEPHLFIGFQPEEELLPKQKDCPVVETRVEEVEMPDPIFIVDQPNARIRLVDTGLSESAVEAFFCMTTSLVGGSAKNTALNEMFIHSIDGLLNLEFSKETEVSWNLEMDGMDLCVFISVPVEGFSENFQKFFQVLKHSSISRGQFEKIKKLNLDNYPGDPQPIDYAHQILDSFLRPFHYTKMELYHNLSELNYEEYEQFQKAYFDQIFVEGAFLGFLKEQEALQLWKELYSILNTSFDEPCEDKAKQFSFQEEAQSYFVLEKTHRKGNALLLLIAADDLDVENEAVHKLITTVLHNEFFEELRTRQQTAYRLYNWNELLDSRICHCFALQSSTHHPLDLLKRVENFLDDFSEKAKDVLTVERFELIRDTLISGWEKQRKEIEELDDIAFIEGEIDSLRSLTYKDVLSGIARIFSKENRRRIAILVEGSQPTFAFEKDCCGVPYLPIEKEKFHR